MSSSTLLLSAKNAMRKELKKRLLAMSSEERAQQSRIIVEKLFKNKKYKESYRISVYLNRDIEVCTYAILEHLFQTEKICFIPKYDSSKPHMDMVRLFSMEDYVTLPSTKWNIKQPSDNSREEALSSGGIDLMIVPGLGFSKNGQRIGNGKGYYDVYLKRCSESQYGCPYTISLAFREQIMPTIPMTEYDMTINEVISPDL